MYEDRGSDFDRAVAEALADEDDGDDAIFTNIEDLILLRGSDLAPTDNSFQKYMLNGDNSVLKDQDAISGQDRLEVDVEEVSVEVPKEPAYKEISDVVKWSDEKTNALLSCLQKHSHKFRRKSIRRNTIWVEISLNMAKLGFLLCNKDDCSKKWNNLYRTYKRIEPNKDSWASWRFFRIVKQLVQLLNWPFSSVLQANLAKKKKGTPNPKVFADFLNAITSTSDSRKRVLLDFQQKVNQLDLSRNDIFKRMSSHLKSTELTAAAGRISLSRKDSTLGATRSGLLPPQLATLNMTNLPREDSEILPSGTSYYLIPWMDPTGTENTNCYQILQVQGDITNTDENNLSLKEQAEAAAEAIAAADAYSKLQLQGPPPQVETFNSKNLPMEFNGADFLPMDMSYHLIQLETSGNEETDSGSYQILQVQRDT